jgi:hypothetical protein
MALWQRPTVAVFASLTRVVDAPVVVDLTGHAVIAWAVRVLRVVEDGSDVLVGRRSVDVWVNGGDLPGLAAQVC